MIQRMSDEHKINFLESEKSSETKQSVTAPKKTLDQISEEQKSKRLANKFDEKIMTSRHISSARTGDITDKGGPTKHIKSESSNTIWDNNKTEKASQELDSKTKTLQEKEQIASNRRESENKRMNDLAETLKSTLQSKASSVSPAGILSGTNYKLSDNNMSIFDKKDFSRLNEKTEGEKVTEDIKNKKAQKDNSWRNGGKAVSTRDVTRNLMDSLFKKSE